MRLINQSYEICNQTDFSISSIYKHIEKCTRVAYKSEDKITENSADKFIKMLLNREHCYDGDTEVFTENGWVKWKDYKGEKVAVINQNFTFKGFEIPSRIINKSYTGNFYYYPSLGTTVTEGHTMYGCFLSNKKNTYEKFVCNTEFYDQNKRHWTMGERPFRVKTVPNKPSLLNPIYELIGFWLGDGVINSSKNQLTFHLKKERKIKYLKELANKLNYQFKERKGNYYCIVQNNIGNYFKNNFSKNKIKYIDLKLSPIDIHSIITGLINSDGSKCKTETNKYNIYFSTTSNYIKEWLSTWAPLAGYTITVTKFNNCYKFVFRTKNVELCNDSRSIERTKVRISFDSKQVYCVTVSTGLLLLRGQNHKSFICGNCAPMEFGTVHFKIPTTIFRTFIEDLIYCNLYNKEWLKYKTVDSYIYFTTNYRYWLELEKKVSYIKEYFDSEDNEYYPKRYTVKLITNRAVSHEVVRHRTMSFIQESQRFVNYSKAKFNNEVTFIKPCWLDLKEGTYTEKDYRDDFYTNNSVKHDLMIHLLTAETTYFKLLEKGWKPQQARVVLPNSTKTELYMCGFKEAWEHFFELRDNKVVDPQMYDLAHPMHQEFINNKYL